jgi:hypothetical protein
MNAFLFAVALILLVLVHYYPPKIYPYCITVFLISINLVFWFMLIKEAIGA